MLNKKRRELQKSNETFIKVKKSKTANSTSIAKDLLPPSLLKNKDYFSKLSIKDQDIILTLMARCMEIGFRRGADHANYLLNNKDKFPNAEIINEFRYSYDLDVAPDMFNKGNATSSRKRLEIQFALELAELGFNYDLLTCNYNNIDPKEFK